MADLTQLELEAQLIEEGRKLDEKRKAAEVFTELLKGKRADFERENELLIKQEKEQRELVATTESGLREKMLAYHAATGSKHFQEAFEIRMTPTPEYDPKALLLWLLNAPTKLAADLLVVNKKEADAWIKDRATEQGGLTPMPYCDPIPALIVQKPTAAILSKGLATLEVPKQVVNGTSNVTTIIVVDNPIMVLTAPQEVIAENSVLPNIDDIPF